MHLSRPTAGILSNRSAGSARPKGAKLHAPWSTNGNVDSLVGKLAQMFAEPSEA